MLKHQHKCIYVPNIDLFYCIKILRPFLPIWTTAGQERHQSIIYWHYIGKGIRTVQLVLLVEGDVSC